MPLSSRRSSLCLLKKSPVSVSWQSTAACLYRERTDGVYSELLPGRHHPRMLTLPASAGVLSPREQHQNLGSGTDKISPNTLVLPKNREEGQHLRKNTGFPSPSNEPSYSRVKGRHASTRATPKDTSKSPSAQIRLPLKAHSVSLVPLLTDPFRWDGPPIWVKTTRAPAGPPIPQILLSSSVPAGRTQKAETTAAGPESVPQHIRRTWTAGSEPRHLRMAISSLLNPDD